MLSKLVVLFLIGMGLLAMFGKWRTKNGAAKRMQGARCPDCGTIKAGRGPCVCKTKDR